MVGLVNAVVVGHFWWAGIGIAYLVLRVWTLRRLIVQLLWLLSVGVLALFWFSHDNQQYERYVWHTTQTRQLTMRVEPDLIQVNGDTVSVQGLTSAGRRVRAFGHLKSEATAQQLKAVVTATTWQLMGTNELLESPRNRLQFDRRIQMRTTGIHGTVKMTQWSFLPASQTLLQWPGDLMHQWRKQLIQRFDQLPAPLSEYAGNLILGATAADFYTQNNGLKQLGLLHLFSISGMHVVYLVGLCRFLLARCGIPREVSQIVLAAGLPLYAIIAGGSGTLVRAILIGEVTLLMPLINRGRRGHVSGLDMWGLSLIGGLLLQPAVLLTLGGQLSYLLAFTLLYVTNEKTWWQTWLMNLASLPLVLHSIFQIHLLSTPVNLLVIPLFGWIIFPVVILGALVGGNISLLTTLSNLLILNFSRIINWLGNLPGMITFGQLPTLLTWICLIVTLLAIDERRFKYRKRWLVALILCYGGAFMWIHLPQDGEVSFIDVGQGDSILLRTPFNQHVSLIDTGGKLGFMKPAWAKQTTNQTTVETVTVNYLHSRGISQIDDVNCSHQDADHIGDVGRLLQLMPVHQLTIPAGMRQSRGFKTKIAPFLKHTKVVELIAGQKYAGLPFTVYHPFRPGPGGNEDSVVLGTIRNGTRFLFTGDLDRVGEREILQQYPTLRVDVLKLGHHGSDTASEPAFISQLQPKLGIISAGRENRYGHPKQSTLTTLAENRVPAINTADVGMITYNYNWRGQAHWETMLPYRNPVAGSPR
ncbi:MAG TPA: DNA internalization-related competence protein ComEC/Rec2 [Lactobacillus sp.]|nr:DNA internalization-related competence protein ComEC/Rec2 [Lactobacillus sp.]